MKLLITLSIAYLTTFGLALCQNLSGEWSGGLPQDDKSWVFTMETSIKQVGNKISGTSKYTSIDNAWVIEKFTGTINGKKVTITETEVVRGTSGWKWCLKTMTGLLKTDTDENEYVIEGTWTSNRLYNGSNYYNDYCAPGKFRITKLLPPKPEEKPTIIESTILGQVIDKQTRKPVKSTLSIIGNKSPMQTIATSNDGKYRYNAPINDVSDIEITENGYEPLRESIKIDNANLTRNFFLIPKRNSPPVKEESLPLPPSIIVNGQTLKKGESIALNSIQFEQTKSDLLPEGKAELDKVIQLMKEYPTLIIELSGHTSNEEKNESMNVKLSEERVAACKNYIANQVKNANSRVKTVGYGSSKPRASNNSEENRKKNRRVELKVESL